MSRRHAVAAAATLTLVLEVTLGAPAAPSARAGSSPSEEGVAGVPGRRAGTPGYALPRVQHPSRFFDERVFAGARAGMPEPRPAPGARAVVVPHHWLAGHLILSGIRDLAAGQQVDRVVLIGPNHSGAGGAPVTTSDGSWATPFGVVEADAVAVRSLVDAGRAFTNPDALTYEHAIAGLVPALAALVPGARLVPLAVHGIREDEVRALAVSLARMMAEPGVTTVLVASVDFSHVLTAEEARTRDPATVAAIRSLDSARLMSFRNEHLDSPGSMATVVETMRLLGATRFVLRENSVSSDIAGHALDGATSYIHGFFSP